MCFSCGLGNALHHGVGDPTGTFCMIFIFSISSSFFFVASRKAAGMGRGGWATGWAFSSILRAYLPGIFPTPCVTSEYCLYTAWADEGILEVLLQPLL